MQNSRNLRHAFLSVLVCFCATTLLSGCDSSSGADTSTTALNDPTESMATAAASNATGSGGETVSAGITDTLDTADMLDTMGAAGTTNAAGTSGAIDTITSTGTTGTANIQSSVTPVIDSSTALADTIIGQGAVTNANSSTNPGTDAGENTSATPGTVPTVEDSTDAVTPPTPGTVPTQLPAAVPQGPDVDRVGSGSIYQPVEAVQSYTSTIDGRRSQALAAVGGSVLQSPRALMEEIDEYYLNDAGQVAFTGRFSVAKEAAYGVWTGGADQLVEIFKTGTSIPGLDEGQTYYKTQKLSLGNDGSLAQIVEVWDATTISEVYLTSRGAEHSVLMKTNTTSNGLIGPVRIDSIELAAQSANTHALVSVERIVTTVPVEKKPGVIEAARDDDEPAVKEVTTNQYSVWYMSGGNSKAVVHSWIDKAQSAPSLGNGCRIYAPDNTVDNLRLSVTGSSHLLFQAQVGGDGDCDQGRAVLRYNGSSYQEVVKDGDAVPGAPTHVFNDVSLYKVATDGSAIVFANLLTPEAIAESKAGEQEAADTQTDDAQSVDSQSEDTQPELENIVQPDVVMQVPDDGKWSFWFMPPQGGARLIAMEGEEIQLGLTVSVLSGEPRNLSLQINDSNQIALKVLLEDAEQPVFFVGTGHAGQPHTSMDVPGASALQYAFTSNSALPGQGNDAVLGNLGVPYVDSPGNLVIYGEVGPSDAAREAAADAAALQGSSPLAAGLASQTLTTPLVKPFNSIWQVGSQGTMRELVRSGDLVNVAGVPKPLASLSVAGQIARPGTSGVRVNSAGAMLLRATIERKFGNSVLLYIAP